MATKGKSARLKGNNFELKISKMLTVWAVGKAEFSRSPSSGAFASSHGKMDANIAGDIITESVWPFNLELKNHETFTSLDTIFHSQVNIQSFWQQNLGDALRTRRVPMLITHRNRSKIYATVPYSALLHKQLKDSGKDYGVFNIRWHDGPLDIDFSQEVLTFVLDDFLELYSYDDIITHEKSWFTEWYYRLENDKEMNRLL